MEVSMGKSTLNQEITKIKKKTQYILILLFALLLNVALVILINMMNHFDYRIYDLDLIYIQNLKKIIMTIFTLSGIALYITYICKFIKLSKKIDYYQKNVLDENKDQNFISIYKKYSNVNITELLFYTVTALIYTYLLVITLQML